MTASVLLLVVSAACDTASIGIVAYLTDDVLATGNLRAFWRPAELWLGLAGVGALASFGGSYLASWTSEHFLLGLRDRAFRHIQQLPPDFFDRNGSGDLVTRLTGDIEAVESLVASAPVEFMTSAVSAAFFATAAVWTNWQLAVVAFSAAPVIWLVTRVFAGRARSASRQERDSNGELASLLEESLANMAVVQAYNQQLTQSAKLHKEGRAWMRAGLRQARLSSAYVPLGEFIETLTVLAVLGGGAWQISEGRLTVGGLFAFAAYVGYLYPHLQSFGDLLVGASSATAASERVQEVLATRPAGTHGIMERSRADVALVRGAITLDGVSFAYPGSTSRILHEARLTVEPGQLVVVTGPSGAGKSTLGKLLPRFYEPTVGRILLDGRDIAELPVGVLREHISLLPQESMLFDGTIRENIRYGRSDATDEELFVAAMEADAHDFITALPEGYDSPVGRRGQRLSGGQRRRVAIARAMIRSAPVLVLDEPTAGLDDASAARVLEPLRRLSAGRTTLLITHDLRLTAGADLVLELDHGSLTTLGTRAPANPFVHAEPPPPQQWYATSGGFAR
ncbi:ABC transporter ATP-binding protein [Streptomyces sp. NBC_00989]|uniref:ABC transporter ATP-binding protein n=1 Tax=Streptomyces sp. NBC_00989 TaxID=2903705 RepID=UPI003864122B|nr:ABC transporter ATP-binding protein/permease [Streptomyces sp. NBC_00989]